MQDLTLFDAFLLGVLAAFTLGCLWLAVPALWWHWQERRRRLDALLDLDRCDHCLVVLAPAITAPTCEAHRYCTSCDGAYNRCTACGFIRDRAGWVK